MSDTPRVDKHVKGNPWCRREPELIELAQRLERENNRLKKDNESLMFLVRNQRCCRNCGNHWSANFEVCGLGEDTVTGRYCREHDLINWRPMEYRYTKAAERGER
jgi:hypothetical protein